MYYICTINSQHKINIMGKYQFETTIVTSRGSKNVSIEMEVFQGCFTNEQIIKMCHETPAKEMDIMSLEKGKTVCFKPYTGSANSSYVFDNVKRGLVMTFNKHSTMNIIAEVYITAI